MNGSQRVWPTEIRYRFEVRDPTNYIQDWAGEIPMLPEPWPFHEYACHKINCSSANILAGARQVEAGMLKKP
ncbi:hypothetical protein [Phenylobacterium sp.]|uniref:hypothetical protein n=1 Tax=Phenylobacterium sp. TaxID=1871053 RepID=UPI001215A604|nr:hypothetical protein [Phenylobacterium sp.]THD55994.1 MAG: hypothetical protein E8A12_15280 [Phenylobacterium sp.]